MPPVSVYTATFVVSREQKSHRRSQTEGISQGTFRNVAQPAAVSYAPCFTCIKHACVPNRNLKINKQMLNIWDS